MTSISPLLLLLLLSVVRVSPIPSCPASCVVCSEEAVICHRLTYIIDAPDTTQALLLTEGSIATVQHASLSDLSNITVIGLSHNHISVLGDQSFRSLSFLHTLMLDHNLLTSQALKGGVLTNLTQLEVLSLGHNLISMLQGDWFKGNKALRSLKLEGNLLTMLDSGSFPLNDLKYLQSLDLSDNLIHHLGFYSFRGLANLQTLDLSRNRLRSAPAEAFSYLSWLANLNLDLNSWNCSCQLLELAAVLSHFIQQPNKTLYNGRRMVCVSADNPAVTTVLELTQANCIPSNQNITVQIETKGRVTHQQYARDLAITAVFCFIGGVVLPPLTVLFYCKVILKEKVKRRIKEKLEEVEKNIAAKRSEVREKRRELFLQAKSRLPWNGDVMPSDPGTDDLDQQVKSQVYDSDSYFWCSDCTIKGQRGMGPNAMSWNHGISTKMEGDEEIEERGVRMMTEQEKRRLGTRQAAFSRDLPNTNSSSHPRTESYSRTSYTEIGEGYRTDMEGDSKGHETLQCKACHRTYRLPEQNIKYRKGRIPTNTRDLALFNGFPSQYGRIDEGVNHNFNLFDTIKTTDFRREAKNVSFDLERLRTFRYESNEKRGEEGQTSRDEESDRGRIHKSKVQSNRSVKVKLNLSPLRKSKIHPKRRAKQGHSDKRSSKKSKDEEQIGKERGERKGRGSSGQKTNKSREKMKKSTKTKGSTEDGEEEKEEDKGGQQKRTSKSGRESTDWDQGENKDPENSEPGDATKIADESASAIATGLGQNIQETGLNFGSAQRLSQHPLSLSASNRNRTTHLSLLSSTSSHLSGHSLSLQGENALLNTMASESISQVPGYPANSIVPGLVYSAPNIAQSGASGGFSRQAGVDLMAPVPSHPANLAHANPLEASPIQTSPLHSTQLAGLALNSTTNPNPASVQSVSLHPDSSFTERPKPDSAQGLGPQTAAAPNQLTPKFQAPQTKDSPTLSTQASPSAEGFSEVTPPAPVTNAENLPDSTGQRETGSVPASTESLDAGVSGDSVQAADVPLSSVSAAVVSTQSVSSAGDADTSAALLQQEYLSEEGGSSPRRKLRLVLPEKTSSRPPTALERKIR